ncbi:molybdopterin converting factor subunit 1 [Exilibacterium tricleocarpae]|uniref:Molybdopterin synthase sulfur carrier subunit n=1 Tax=Exilibacterium tricleocarpae TaxID=2591008 RepID=A0A545U838_9GAMM|nr:molybdopterin converting factor subunit 1 [Exilibacterium tricleocarpae]TQV85637.1 molybdopterin converting factor subunit 1 [Exilibacterium tricleocarpae]
MIKLLYFARFRDQLDCAEEQLALPAHIDTVADLAAHLSERGANWRGTLADSQALVAVNQEISGFETAVKDGDEIAFFPPVTGG